jgi:nucleolysin TIA-1/TIAR
MYGMPQPNAYAQYGFGGAGYGGFANGQGSAGMPQPNPAQAGAGMGMAQDSAAMGAQGNTAPGQWGASDPNAFYQQQAYWGGKST